MHAQPSTRKLLLFGQAQTDFKEQLSLLKKDSAGMAERDLVVSIVEKEAEYQKYGVKRNAFTVILIGKDGGEKFRSDKPVAPDAIFGLIDTMPMRQSEIRGKTN